VNKEEVHRQTERLAAVGADSAKRTYSSPRLTAHGDLRDMTCGASGANPESGGAFFNLV
jgi:hypothetical protein